MGAARPAPPVKLIVGLLGADPDLLRRARQLLVRAYGPVELVSPAWPFTATRYYEPEMGGELLRQFISFERLVRPEALADIKRTTNRLEEEIAAQALLPGVSRPVNLDPGCVDPARLILATTKDRAHRIYLGLGIYAEVTLHFEHGAWRAAEWTYPDYRSPEYHAFFSEVRTRCLAQRSELAELSQRSAAQSSTQPTAGADPSPARVVRPVVHPQLATHAESGARALTPDEGAPDAVRPYELSADEEPAGR